jgi:hypothetical protein
MLMLGVFIQRSVLLFLLAMGLVGMLSAAGSFWQTPVLIYAPPQNPKQLLLQDYQQRIDLPLFAADPAQNGLFEPVISPTGDFLVYETYTQSTVAASPFDPRVYDPIIMLATEDDYRTLMTHTYEQVVRTRHLSPDGQHFIYTVNPDAGSDHLSLLYRISLTAPEAEPQVTELPYVQDLIWRPNGQMRLLMFPDADPLQAAIYDRDESPADAPLQVVQEQLLANSEVDLSEYDLEGMWLAPDGDSVALLMHERRRASSDDIYQVQIASGELTRLTHTPDDTVGEAAWSADSRRIAYPVFSREGASLHVIDVESGQQHTIASLQEGRLYDILWSPTGSHLAYVRRISLQPDLFCVGRADGRAENCREDAPPIYRWWPR